MGIYIQNKTETLEPLEEADHLHSWVYLGFFYIALTQSSSNRTLCQENAFLFFFSITKKLDKQAKFMALMIALTVNFMLPESYRQ